MINGLLNSGGVQVRFGGFGLYHAGDCVPYEGQADRLRPYAVDLALLPINGRAPVVRAASPVRLDDPASVRGRRVLVVEDGPTLTHGGMAYGAGYVAATAAGAFVLSENAVYTTEAWRVFIQHLTDGGVLSVSRWYVDI